MPLVPNAYTRDTIIIGTIQACKTLGVDDLATVCCIACQKVESDHIMWANTLDPHSMDYPYQKLSTDQNSAGIYQQRFPWWDDPTTDDYGGASDRMDVFRSTKLFVNSLLKQRPNYHDNPGEAIANTQNCRADLRYKYGLQIDYAWSQFNRLKDAAAHQVGLPAAPPVPQIIRPTFQEIEMFGWGRNSRSRPAINAFIHTEEGNSTAEQLARFCDGSNNVSYHYTIRDRIVCDVVDTDYYSWSVLDANVFSINYCFAGSRASWSYEEWMKRSDDIDIVAYLIVQDCLKYPKMSTLVIPPPYTFHGPGISDHKYVTQALHIGTHTDCGNNFPWKFLETRILYYSGFTTAGDDQMTKEEHDALFQIWGALFNPVASGSPYAPPDEGNRWPSKDLPQHIDAFTHGLSTDHDAIILGMPDAIHMTYDAMSFDDPVKAARAKKVWALIPAQFKTDAGYVKQ